MKHPGHQCGTSNAQCILLTYWEILVGFMRYAIDTLDYLCNDSPVSYLQLRRLSLIFITVCIIFSFIKEKQRPLLHFFSFKIWNICHFGCLNKY